MADAANLQDEGSLRMNIIVIHPSRIRALIETMRLLAAVRQGLIRRGAA